MSSQENNVGNYRQWLSVELERRKIHNPRYSLRSFSSKLGLSPAALSQILSGKRRLTERGVRTISARLNLDPRIAELLRDSILKERAVAAEMASGPAFETHVHIALDKFRLIADWYHYAILSLSEVRGVRMDPAWIAKRLGISLREARDAFERLTRMRLIETTASGFRQICQPLSTKDDLSDPALRKHLLQHFRKAEAALDEPRKAALDFSSITMAIDEENLPKAKLEIKRFRRRLAALLENGMQKRVYALSIQLYPLDRELHD